MPDDSGTALVVVDVLNPYQHEDPDQLAESMAGTVDQIALLLDRARDEQRPVIYVNDNYGHRNSSSSELLEVALQEGRPPRARRAPAPAARRPADTASSSVAELRHEGATRCTRLHHVAGGRGYVLGRQIARCEMVHLNSSVLSLGTRMASLRARWRTP